MKSKKNEYNLSEAITKHPAWSRLIDQLEWYDKKSVQNQNYYKILKVIQFTFASLITILSFIKGQNIMWVTAILGASIAFLEGLQQLFQFSTLWITYRSTAEHLKHEKYLFLSQAGQYNNLNDSERLILLAERVEEHVSSEHANWFNVNEIMLKSNNK